MTVGRVFNLPACMGRLKTRHVCGLTLFELGREVDEVDSPFSPGRRVSGNVVIPFLTDFRPGGSPTPTTDAVAEGIRWLKECDVAKPAASDYFVRHLASGLGFPKAIPLVQRPE